MITNILLRNFKAFAEVSIPLGRLTLLSGLNSSGKSTVLQALSLLRQSADAGTLTPPTEGAGFLLNGDLVDLGVGQDVRHEAWVPTRDGRGAIEIELTTTETTAGWAVDYGTEDDLLPMLACAPVEDAERISLFGPGFQYLRADRITPAVSYPRSHNAAIRKGFLGARGEHTVNYLRHHQDDEVGDPALCRADTESTTLLRQTEAWLGHLCPGVNLSTAGIDGTDTVRLSYSFGTAGLSSSNQYRPTNVGFGLTYVLPIVVACLTARPGTVILLENPEAHLHPRGQAAMAELISRAAKAGAQVVVESHSDHVLNGIRIAVKHKLLEAADLRLLYFRSDRAGRHVDNLEVSPDGMVSSWPAGFFDEWDRALDELID